MNTFLTADELVTLTGLRRPSAQVRFLRAARIRHVVNAVGHPVIMRAWLTGEDAPANPLRRRPDLRAVPGVA